MWYIFGAYPFSQLFNTVSLFQTRRAELEGLDLAIERQKQELHSMKESERVLLSQREAARDELRELKSGRDGRRSRRRWVIPCRYRDGVEIEIGQD